MAMDYLSEMAYSGTNPNSPRTLLAASPAPPVTSAPSTEEPTSWTEQAAQAQAKLDALRSTRSSTPAPQEPSKWSRAAEVGYRDIPISLAKGVVDIGKMSAGIMDLPTGGYAGKLMSKLYDFNAINNKLTSWMSPGTQEAFKKVEEAKGFMPQVRTALQNPSTLVAGTAQMIPAMVGGEGIGALSLKAFPALARLAGKGITSKLLTNPITSRMLASGIGMGAMGAGLTAEEMRSQNESGLLTPRQALGSMAVGLSDALITAGGAKIAKALKVTTPAMAALDVATGRGIKAVGAEGLNAVNRIGRGAVVEGVFGQMPRSVSGQVIRNITEGKDAFDDIGTAAGGGLMQGLAAGAFTNIKNKSHGINDALIDALEERVAGNENGVLDIAENREQTRSQTGEPVPADTSTTPATPDELTARLGALRESTAPLAGDRVAALEHLLGVPRDYLNNPDIIGGMHPETVRAMLEEAGALTPDIDANLSAIGNDHVTMDSFIESTRQGQSATVEPQATATPAVQGLPDEVRNRPAPEINSEPSPVAPVDSDVTQEARRRLQERGIDPTSAEYATALLRETLSIESERSNPTTPEPTTEPTTEPTPTVEPITAEERARLAALPTERVQELARRAQQFVNGSGLSPQSPEYAATLARTMLEMHDIDTQRQTPQAPQTPAPTPYERSANTVLSDEQFTRAQGLFQELSTIEAGSPQSRDAVLASEPGLSRRVAELIKEIPVAERANSPLLEELSRNTGVEMASSGADLVQRIQNGATVNDLLTHLADNSNNQFHRKLSSALLRLMEQRGLQAGLIDPNDVRYGNTRGLYSGGENSIKINSALATEQTFIHEALHAATVDGVLNNPRLRQDIGNLLRHVWDHAVDQGYDPMTYYGFQFGGSIHGRDINGRNTHIPISSITDAMRLEFVAEALGRREFQELLARTPSSPGNPLQSAWQSLTRMVRRFLHLNDDAVTNSALGEALSLGSEAMAETRTNNPEVVREFIQAAHTGVDPNIPPTVQPNTTPTTQTPTVDVTNPVEPPVQNPSPTTTTTVNTEGQVNVPTLTHDQLKALVLTPVSPEESVKYQNMINNFLNSGNDIVTTDLERGVARVWDKIKTKVDFKFGTTKSDNLSAICSAISRKFSDHGQDVRVRFRVEMSDGSIRYNPRLDASQKGRSIRNITPQILTSAGWKGDDILYNTYTGGGGACFISRGERPTAGTGALFYYMAQLAAKNIDGFGISSDGLTPINQQRRAENAFSFLARYGSIPNVSINFETPNSLRTNTVNPYSTLIANTLGVGRDSRPAIKNLEVLSRFRYEFTDNTIREVNTGAVIPVKYISTLLRSEGDAAQYDAHFNNDTKSTGVSRLVSGAFSDATVERAIINQTIHDRLQNARNVNTEVNRIRSEIHNNGVMFPPILYDRASDFIPTGTKSVDIESHLQSHIEKIAAKGCAVKVIQSATEMPGYHPDMPAFDGAYHEGVIYLVSDHIKSKEHATTLLVDHELRHFGLRSILGEDGLDRYLTRVWFSQKDAVLNHARETLGLDIDGHGKDSQGVNRRLEAAEEYLVSLAGEAKSSRLMDRTVTVVRTILRNMGINLAISHRELRDMISRAGSGYGFEGVGNTRFSRTWQGSKAKFDQYLDDFIGMGEGHTTKPDFFKSFASAWNAEPALPEMAGGVDKNGESIFRFNRLPDIDRVTDALHGRSLDIMKKVVKGTVDSVTPFDRMINFALSRPEFYIIKDQLTSLQRNRSEKSSFFRAPLDAMQVQVNKLTASLENKTQTKAFNELAAKGSIWGIQPELAINDPNQPWNAKKWKDRKMDVATGKDFQSAYNHINGLYRMLTPQGQKEYLETAKQISRNTEELRQAMLEWVDKTTPETTPQNAISTAVVNGVVKYIGQREIDKRAINRKFSYLKGHYYPLARFGDTAVNVYKIDPSAVDGFGERVSMKKFEYESDAKAFRDQMVAQGYMTTITLDKEYARMKTEIPTGLMNRMEQAMTDLRMPQSQKDELTDRIYRIWASLTPEASAMKHQMKRTGLAGYEEDMVRGVLQHAQSHGKAISFLKRGLEIRNNFMEMETIIADESKRFTPDQIAAATADPNKPKGLAGKDLTNVQELVNKLRIIDNDIAGEKVAPWVFQATKLPFLWYMTSPSIFAVQTAQPFMTSAPKMAVKHGMLTSQKELIVEYGRQLSKVNGVHTYSNERIHQYSDIATKYIDILSMPEVTQTERQMKQREMANFERVNLKSMSDTDKKLFGMEVATKWGAIDITLTHDGLEYVNYGNKSTTSKIMNKASYFMSVSEVASRKATFAAAFNLQMKKNGGNIHDAIEYSTHIVKDTLFDYDKSNRPTALLGSAGRFLGQFQTYRLNYAAKLALLAHESFTKDYQGMTDQIKEKYGVESFLAKNGTIDPASVRGKNGQALTQEAIDGFMKEQTTNLQGKSAARKELGYNLLMGFLLAGVHGLPGFTAGIAFTNFIVNALNDEDDAPFDAETNFHNITRSMPMGSVIDKGLPALAGLDVSRRIGADQIYNVIQGEPPENLRGRQLASWYITKLAGPVAGPVTDFFVAKDTLHQKGMAEALRQAAPKPMRDFANAMKLASGEDYTNSSGKKLINKEQVNLLDVALMAVGINPTKISLANEKQADLTRVSIKIQNHRRDLSRALVEAIKNDDYDAKQKAIEDISAFSRKNPMAAINGGEIVNMIKDGIRKSQGIDSNTEIRMERMYGIEDNTDQGR